MIDRQELEAALKEFGYNLLPDILDTIMYRVDKTGAYFCLFAISKLRLFDFQGLRTMSFSAFVRVCVVLQAITATFRRHEIQVLCELTEVFFNF